MITCYMCDEEATSFEHVPPKCLFPEQKDLPEGIDLRKSLITVPSCEVHNSQKSDDDEYLLYCLAMSIPSNNVGKDHFLSKVIRAVKRNPSLIKKLLHNSHNAQAENLSTNEVFETIGFQVDDLRFDKAIEQLSRALYFYHFGKKSNGQLKIYPNFLLSMEDNYKETNGKIAEMDIMAEKLFSEENYYGSNPEVFKYCAVDTGIGQPKFLRLYFYGGNRVTVIFVDED